MVANDDDVVCPPCGSGHGLAPPGEPASLRVHVPGGSIRFYFHDGRFEATCGNDAHRSVDGVPCRLTRSSFGEPDGDSPNGRPMGTLAAWCSHAFQPGFDRADHRSPFFTMGLSIDERENGRARVREASNGIGMLSKERPQRAGEPSEPRVVPMGW